MTRSATDTWLFSTSGGTDMCTAFVGGVPTLPVYLGELQARSLGAPVEAWDPDGKPLIDEVGELVITEPMPSMPIFLWGDEDGSRLRDSYFSMYPGVWRHGDWIEITSRGTAIIYGRSDSTINRGGVRMGTSEIYRAVLEVPDVVDALVVDLPREGTDGWMPLFVVLRDGIDLSDDLVGRDQAADPRGLLAAPRAQRDPADPGGAADAVGQGARGAGQADPDGHASGAGREPRVAGQSGGAGLLRGACSSGRPPACAPARQARRAGGARLLRLRRSGRASRWYVTIRITIEAERHPVRRNRRPAGSALTDFFPDSEKVLTDRWSTDTAPTNPGDESDMSSISRWMPIIGGAVAGGVIALVIAGGSGRRRSR